MQPAVTGVTRCLEGEGVSGMQEAAWDAAKGRGLRERGEQGARKGLLRSLMTA